MQMTRSFLGTVCKLKGNNQVTGRNPDPHSLRWITDYLPAQLSISQKRLATCGMVGSALATLNLHWGFGIFPFSLPFLVLSPLLSFLSQFGISLPIRVFPTIVIFSSHQVFAFPESFSPPIFLRSVFSVSGVSNNHSNNNSSNNIVLILVPVLLEATCRANVYGGDFNQFG
jgi:hypothetical protein